MNIALVEQAKEVLAQKPLFLDTETTGLGPADEIVEIAIIDSNGKTLLDTLIKPTIPISSAAFLIHGISECDIVNTPSFAIILPQLLAIMENRAIVIYNAEYDVRMLKQSAKAHNLKIELNKNVYCAMHMYAEFLGDWNHSRGAYRWHKLEIAAQQCGINISQNRHRARTDAELTRCIVTFIANADPNRL